MKTIVNPINGEKVKSKIYLEYTKNSSVTYFVAVFKYNNDWYWISNRQYQMCIDKETAIARAMLKYTLILDRNNKDFVINEFK